MDADPTVQECEVPSSSVLDRGFVSDAYFRDSYRVPLRLTSLTLPGIFTAIFGHHPAWMKRALIARNRVAALCGLDVSTDAEVLHFEVKRSYSVGDKIGTWAIFSLADNEIVSGRDNKHLDFRLSVLREDGGAEPHVVVSTVCVVHNWYGKAYLFFVVPFHRRGVQLLLSRAMAAGRL
jgi:hypothetical protein